MHNAPLIGPYNPEDILAWEHGRPRTAGHFLHDVAALVDRLPDRPAVLNIASSRYRFLVGFAAALLRQQVTLLPQTRVSQNLRTVAKIYGASHCLTDGEQSVPGLSILMIPSTEQRAGFQGSVPCIPVEQTAAVVFTSGSTGAPVPNHKPWGALVTVALTTGARFGFKVGERRTMVATVPHQHMFGLEAAVMLPLMHGFTIHAGRPLFPEDVRQALTEVSAERVLVTTPLHIRACLMEPRRFPDLAMILSATAPLPVSLAEEAERHFHTQVHEIYGFSEAGCVATRRTSTNQDWELLDRIALRQEREGWAVHAEYLAEPVRCPDRLSMRSETRFTLHGRVADQISVAGHRASLKDLNQKLVEIAGVQDGVFFLPDEHGVDVTRLIAFAVAPGKTVHDIQEALRTQLDPAFLPRPLILVPSLPRNETGKLTRDALLRLAGQYVTDHAT